MDIYDHMTLSYEFPNGIHVNFEGSQMSPPGFGRIGEEFSGTKGVLETSRVRMIHTRGLDNKETIESKRDITLDGIESFLGRILSGDVENVAERSALSTMIAFLGRAAVYSGREATWKGEFGA
jgi:hypothetical protein